MPLNMERMVSVLFRSLLGDAAIGWGSATASSLEADGTGAAVVGSDSSVVGNAVFIPAMLPSNFLRFLIVRMDSGDSGKAAESFARMVVATGALGVVNAFWRTNRVIKISSSVNSTFFSSVIYILVLV